MKTPSPAVIQENPPIFAKTGISAAAEIVQIFRTLKAFWLLSLFRSYHSIWSCKRSKVTSCTAGDPMLTGSLLPMANDDNRALGAAGWPVGVTLGSLLPRATNTLGFEAGVKVDLHTTVLLQ